MLQPQVPQLPAVTQTSASPFTYVRRLVLRFQPVFDHRRDVHQLYQGMFYQNMLQNAQMQQLFNVNAAFGVGFHAAQAHFAAKR